MSVKIEVVVGPEGTIIGEGPFWSAKNRVLWWIDIKAPAIHRFDPATGKDTRWSIDVEIGTIFEAASGGLPLVGGRGGFFRFDPSTGRLTPFVAAANDNPLMRFNDGRTDRQGRVWTGTMLCPYGPPTHYMERAPDSALWRLDGDGVPRRMIEGIRVTNGFAFSPDGRTMYFADSPTHEIVAFDYDPTTGTPSNRRVFARIPRETGRGTPDGSTVDAEGFLWNAEFRGRRLVRYAPDGSVDRTIMLPVSRPACPEFGGPDLATLYLTSGRIMLTPEELAKEPLAGALFALDVGVRGVPAAPWAG